MRAAAIGVGSNSTRLLVADAEGGRITPVERVRLDTKLFLSLEAGMLSAQGMQHTTETVAALFMRALAAGAQRVQLVATSATRDAKNADAFSAMMEEACGIPLRILTGEEEARLSFLGATGGRPAGAGVLDIGGGSTELAAEKDGSLAAMSLQLGSSRLKQMFGDLTKKKDAQSALEYAVQTISAHWTDRQAREWISVGGNGYRLARADRFRKGLNGASTEGWRMTLADVEAWTERLCAMSVAERAQTPGFPASRADVAAQGAVILLAAMKAIGMEAVTVTKRTNLDGLLLEM